MDNTEVIDYENQNMVLLTNRIYPRYNLNDSATVITEDGRQQRLLLKNLSIGGAGLFGSISVSLGQKVTVILNAPFYVALGTQRKARVAWTRKVGPDQCELGLDFGIDKISWD